MNIETSIFLERGNPEMQDRAEILSSSGRTLVLIADGAGGISGGAEAAEFVARSAATDAANLSTAKDCEQWLRSTDQKIAEAPNCGETTAIISLIGPDTLYGAAVGDSAIWLFSSNGREHLTHGALRKPFLGTKNALPHPFELKLTPGTLVIATDGLWKYTSIDSIESTVRSAKAADSLAAQLAQLARLRSSTFPDDIAIITCRIT